MKDKKLLLEQTKTLLARLAETQEGSFSKNDMDELVDVLHFHENQYYIQDNPLIADYEYDRLYKHLEQKELENPSLKRIDSPTQRVSVDLVSEFNSVPHLSPMLSLANSYDADDLKDFDAQVKKWTGTENQILQYAVEPKFDGGTICLVYDEDILVRAATRGNGTLGEEMTHNAKRMNTIPLRALFSKYGIKKVELRGEALIPLDKFKEVNAQREKEGLEILANPRNAATGALRVKDSREVSKRKLEAFVYQISYIEWIDEPKPWTFHSQGIKILNNLGFKTPDTKEIICQGIEEVIAKCDYWQSIRDEYAYEIDGMVVKVDSLALQEESGYTAHHPRWAIAYKFKAKQATSKLLQVEFQVGKIGSITPVAKIEPTPLAGVTVSSITLHNEDFIRSKDLRIGDTILIERAGDVIPYIVKSFPEYRTGDETLIQFPTHCPSCNSVLKKNESEAAWKCENTLCPAQILQRIIHHASKDAMDIEGLGKSIIERFNELGWIQNIADIYRLDYTKIAELEGFGAKSAENLKNAIEKAKNNPLQRLLYSLSIPLLGQKASKTLAQYVESIFDFCEWQTENYTAIKDIGPVLAGEMERFFSNETQVNLLKELAELGVNTRQLDEDKPHQFDQENAPLLGKTILFTGSLSMDRKKAEKLAETAGAKNISAVSKNLNILVVGENAGSKLTKAQSLGTVVIWTEDEFLEAINYK